MDHIAWAAGLFEGEGCFFVNKVGRGYQYPAAALHMTDKDIVERFSEVVGFGRIRFSKSRKAHWKDSWVWYCNGLEPTKNLFELFKPLLGIRRTKTAQEVLSVMPFKKEKLKREHGTRARYRSGCRCQKCRTGNRNRMRVYRTPA